jgi:hypothetical protein
MTDRETLMEVLKTIRSMRQSLSRYHDSDTKRAKLSVLNVIEGIIL